MAQFVVMTYNIEWMNLMFRNNVIKSTQRDRAQKIAQVIQGINPHVLGICEAANSPDEHRHFIDNYLPGSGYQLAHGASRGGQNLVFYYRSPFSLVSVDGAISYYGPWEDDVDRDGLRERHKWERKPLEAVFEIGQAGPQLRTILVHTKSKGVFSVVDLHDFQRIAYANRVRLTGQATRLRSRLDALLQEQDSLSTIVMGDLNDGPGLDPYEKMLGRSFVETLMRSVFEPGTVLHNTLWWMSKGSRTKRDLWTVAFPDPIVTSPLGWKHRVWLDHILVSPDMLEPANSVRCLVDSGRIAPKNRDSREASDHSGVYCTIET